MTYAEYRESTGMTEHAVPRALSWWQPFGTLMLHGKIEIRRWSTLYRGPVLICTTQKSFWKQSVEKRAQYSFSHQNRTDMDYCALREALFPINTNRLHGYAIAIGRLVDCRPSKPEDNTFFQHKPDDFAHLYADIKRIEPFKVKGYQKWGTVDVNMRELIKII